MHLAATSFGPGGPYVDTSTAPLVCGDREALDPEAVVGADGAPVLLWKRERPAAIVAAPLTPDGLALAGDERELLARVSGGRTRTSRRRACS